MAKPYKSINVKCICLDKFKKVKELVILGVLKGNIHISDEPNKIKDKVTFWRMRATLFQKALVCLEDLFVSEKQYEFDLKVLKDFVSVIERWDRE